MTNSLQPLYGNILVRVETDSQLSQTAGGLYIPETAKRDRQVVGMVVATGSGRVDGDGSVRPLITKPGDRVLFDKEVAIAVQDDHHFILSEQRVLAKVSE